MIKLDNVSVAYKKGKPVLNSISMELQPGHIYGLLGKNGEGKTTLLNILSGQLFPNSGSCEVLGSNPTKRSASFLQQLFILPEVISFPNVTANDYIRMYAPFYPCFSEDTWNMCFDTLEIDGSAKLAKMSMGQKKKVAITLALSVKTPLLLMDEPTNGLDIPSKATFRKLISSCMTDEQTVIISTHQVRDLESLIDSVLILEKKEMLMNCSLDDVSRKLSFRLTNADEKVLYSEPSPIGMMGVVPRREDEEDTPVSLELLFNAAISRPNEMHQLFTNH